MHTLEDNPTRNTYIYTATPNGLKDALTEVVDGLKVPVVSTLPGALVFATVGDRSHHSEGSATHMRSANGGESPQSEQGLQIRAPSASKVAYTALPTAHAPKP